MSGTLRAAAREMQSYAYTRPLVQARGAVLPYFRQLGSRHSIGLTVNK